MEFEANGLSREEIRKRRRKKERTQAIVILAVVVLVILILIGTAVFALVKIFAKKETDPKPTTVDAVATESLQEEPVESTDMGVDETEEQTADESGKEASGEDGDVLPEEEETDADAADKQDEQGIFDEKRDAELEELVNQKISSMTLEEKVAGLFFVTPAQLLGIESDVTVVGGEFGEKLAAYPVGGIVLDESNMTGEGEDDFSTLIANVRNYASADAFIGIEESGGAESPFVVSGLTENVISSQKEIGETLGISGAYSAGISIGSELHQYGINVNFSPNVDVSAVEGSVAEKEGFGVDAETTSELGKNMVKGLSDQGIYVAVGHFPGYSDVTQDGDGGQVISDRTKEDLQKEYAPYIEAIDAGADFVMISHVSLPKIRGDKRPASLSKEVITDIVRTEWGYDGIIITDFMNRSCIYKKYTYAEAAVGAIEAGADMILAPKNFLKSYNGILDAVNKGTLTQERIDESLRRIYRVKLANQVEE